MNEEDGNDEVFLEGLNKSRGMRLLQGMFHWCEAGRRSTFPTSLSRMKVFKDRNMAEPDLLMHSNHTIILQSDFRYCSLSAQ
jgi:hypothetical protein